MPGKAPRLTEEQRSLRAQIAINTRWAHCDDRAAATAPGRKGFDERFEREVDPDNSLLPEERYRRAQSARKAFFAKLALASATARRRRKGDEHGNTTA